MVRIWFNTNLGTSPLWPRIPPVNAGPGFDQHFHLFETNYQIWWIKDDVGIVIMIWQMMGLMIVMFFTTATSSLRQASISGVNPAGVVVFTWRGRSASCKSSSSSSSAQVQDLIMIIFIIITTSTSQRITFEAGRSWSAWGTRSFRPERSIWSAVFRFTWELKVPLS